MPLYYVTGAPGSGKSSVQMELQRRGFTAYETDDLAAFYNKYSGEVTTSGRTAAARTEAWHKHHEWKISANEIEKLRSEAKHKIVFLCGVFSNESEYFDKFDRIFGLLIPPAQLEHRLRSRPGGEVYGKNEHELAVALEWAASAEERFRNVGAVIIDATRPLDTVTEEIINAVKTHDTH